MAKPTVEMDIQELTRPYLENVRELQERVLRSLLEKHGDCEYLRRHGLNGATDVQSFREQIPCIKFEDIADDVNRILLEGDKSNILCCDPIVRFHISSGTSGGKMKWIPVTDATVAHMGSHREFASKLNSLNSSLRRQKDEMILCLGIKYPCLLSPSGIMGSAATTFIFNKIFEESPNTFSSPRAALLEDYHQSIYCHLLCGLLNYSKIFCIWSTFGSVLAGVVEILKQDWEELCQDIETGKLSSRITDGAAREAVSKLLKNPNAELAARIRSECQKVSWGGILVRLWPRLRYVSSICTGSMLLYHEHLRFLIGDGSIPIVSTSYASSESYLAFNLRPTKPPADVRYCFDPFGGFFEFKSVRDSSIVELADVKGGEEYEVILTNLAGLWRYQLGDIVKCTGFTHHSAPEFQVIGRSNVFMSLTREATTEQEITHAVESATREHLPPEMRLVDYTTTVDMTALPGHYVVILDIERPGRSDPIGNAMLEKLGISIETALNESYRTQRLINTIAPLEVIVVKPDCFAALRIASGSVQYKQPRVYQHGHPSLKFIYSSIQERHPSCPRD